MQRASVDLPQPDSPTMPSVSPSRTLRLTPSTAFTAPICFLEDDPLADGEVLLEIGDDEQLVSLEARGLRLLRLLLQRHETGAPVIALTIRAASRSFVASSRWHACRWAGSLRAGMSSGSVSRQILIV